MEIYNPNILYQYDQNKKIIHYKFLLNRYEAFLSFFYNEKSSFYLNLNFLAQVVDGFSMIQDSIFDNPSTENYDLISYFKSKDIQLKGKKDEREISSADRLFIFSSCCYAEIFKYDLTSCADFIIDDMFRNCYKVDQVVNKEYIKNRTM